ncbi:MrcB family domain-containing protein [Alicyclobacillus dauci]|uniref:DUF3578 domain-containing protein n=1 Tax=Alicyclobacillus dauci TaxID=1475485 RepID=A0ABY6Z335_9BACL|nr:DUF3578 domain-containing protein [Alicyclobacillus dauci]WAH37033.1 DUF3578 domain-containing protein [Alicyclobacillus dauci]
MSGVYLSLNQGWTYYKEKHPRKIHNARNEIRSVALAWREVLTSNLNDFDTTEIDLHHKGSLAEGYELGHICGKFYDALQIPDDTVLVADLTAMIGVYRELKGRMEDVQDLSVTNEDILVSKAVSEDVDDTKFQQRVSAAQPKYTASPQPKKEPRVSRGRKSWQRDIGIARGALENANFLCEFDPTHVSYTSKRTGRNYVEAHHLVPLNLQDQFEYSLDVTANVVALCRNCHGRIHYAVASEKEEVLEKLYELRRERLLGHGIDIGLEDLKRAYD